MTNPGEDAGETASSDSSTPASEPESAGYEAPPIEQSQEPGESVAQPEPTPEPQQVPEQPAYAPPPAYHAPPAPPPGYEAPGFPPAHGYPPPSFPPPAYPPPGPPGYAPVDYPTDGGLPPPIYPAPYPGAGYDPYRPMKPPGTNGKAIAALVCSASGLACCVTAIPGVILGIAAMRETKRTGQEGYGLALAGTIIGALLVAGMLLYLLVIIGLAASGWQWT